MITIRHGLPFVEDGKQMRLLATHGDCAAEITRLRTQVASLEGQLAGYKQACDEARERLNATPPATLIAESPVSFPPGDSGREGLRPTECPHPASRVVYEHDINGFKCADCLQLVEQRGFCDPVFVTRSHVKAKADEDRRFGQPHHGHDSDES